MFRVSSVSLKYEGNLCGAIPSSLILNGNLDDIVVVTISPSFVVTGTSSSFAG